MIGHRTEVWTHKIRKEEEVDGKDCWVNEALPQNKDVSENSGYSKRPGWIEKESFIAIRGENFDLSGQLLKKFTAKNVQKVDAATNKWQAMTLEAENVQTNHRTVLEFKSFKANVGLAEDLFTSRSLEKQ